MRVHTSATRPLREAPTGIEDVSGFSQQGRRWLARLGLFASLWAAIPAIAATAPTLGAAQSYAVFGATTVTSTGASAITGDVGVSPGTSVTGFPPGTVSGTIHANDGAAIAAKGPITAAYAGLSQACNTNLTGQDLGGMTLSPGVYCFDTSAQLTGTLTLNALGDPNAVFIFRTGTTLTTATSAAVNLINSAQACNVFWQIGSSATLGTTTAFTGNVLATASVTLTNGSSLTGRALALNGAVTLDTNAVAITSCAAPSVLPTVTLTKVSNGGVGTFSFSGNNGVVGQSITTVTPGVGVSAPAQTLSAAGAVTTVTESTPPVGYTLSSVTCSGLGAGGVATPNLAARSVTLDAAATAAGAAMACTFTNTLASPVLPTVAVTKVSNGGVGTFNFSGDNGFLGQSITTSTSGVGVAAPVQTLSAAGALTTLTESTLPTGYTLSSVACTGLGTGGVATPNLAARSVTLDAAATASGAVIACTFVNTINPVVLVSESIPTLSEWSLFVLSSVMVGLGFLYLRRRGDGRF